jgi:hypothetical protein
MSERAPRRRGYWFAVMVTLLVCLMARAAVADDQNGEEPRLLVFSDQLGDPLVSRVLGELRSQGFEVITVSAAAAGIPDREVLAMAEAARAVAAVRIVVSESAVDLKVTDSMTEGTFVRRLEVEGDRTVAALRTVEVLRTRLINLLALAPRRGPRVVEPARPTATSAPPRQVRAPPARAAFGLALGAAVAESPGGSTPSWHALAAFRWSTPTELLVEALALLPVSRSEFRERDGSARLGFGWLGAGIGWQPMSGRRWSPDLGAGVAGMLVRVQGMPSAGLTGHTDTSLAASPYFRTGFSVACWKTLAVRGDLLAALAVPRTVILFGDRQVGSWGRPVVLGSAGFAWTWQ